ncbi:hypothetical protein SAMN05421685_105111 [Thalassovita mediterranea]|nr:hypothetical protein SAMN05421685_105111 [Thalassovita mediterranea]
MLKKRIKPELEPIKIPEFLKKQHEPITAEQRKNAEENHLMPPWDVFPEYSLGGAGWYGEMPSRFLLEFTKWYCLLGPDARNAYKAELSIPVAWEGFLEEVEAGSIRKIWPELCLAQLSWAPV